jgi:signal transduction histidine kinase
MSSDDMRAISPRLSRAEALSQLRDAQALQAGPVTLDTAGVPTAVINERRQVIFANSPFRELIGAGSLEDLCGQRPGEVLGCIHAVPGCGESASCRFCGAAQAIVETQRTRQGVSRECHLTVCDTERAPARDFLVRTTPFEITGRPFVLMNLIDISDQKRRQSLQRLFFHDILNTTSSFKVYLHLLQQGSAATDKGEIVARLQDICGTLEEEIKGQKVMMSAECGTLQVQRNLIESQALAEHLVRQWEGQDLARDRTVVTEPFSESFTFISDDSLVKRILGNMVKNALEASVKGTAVRIALHLEGTGSVRIEVHNNACIDLAVQAQIFRRFFSTKGPDRGVGTWGMRLLAEDYLGGRVGFTSTEEEGTTFVLTLPRKPCDL